MHDLTQKHCVPCEAGTEPMPIEEAERLVQQIDHNWKLNEYTKSISKDYTFKNFKEAMAFANKIADIAEEEGHHPDLFVSWGKVHVDLSTHAIQGLSENDFILASKIDQLEQ